VDEWGVQFVGTELTRLTDQTHAILSICLGDFLLDQDEAIRAESG
jgi:hypothetical protein